MAVPPSPTIAPAEGRLGVLTVGLGAVASTLIAGVELVKRGMSAPVGSLTQMGTIRLGKRTDNRRPLLKDFLPLASLDVGLGFVMVNPELGEDVLDEAGPEVPLRRPAARHRADCGSRRARCHSLREQSRRRA